jgi:hypothetical protein
MENKEYFDPVRRYAFVTEGDVFLVMEIGEKTTHSEMLVAAFDSGPQIIDATGNSGVQLGWTWDGTTFQPPVE